MSDKDIITIAVFDRDDWSKEVGRVDIWKDYQITNQKPWEGCATFSVTPASTSEVRDLFHYAGNRVEICCGEDLQMTGCIDEVQGDSAVSGSVLTITGRTIQGVMIDSAAPRMTIAGMTAGQLISALAQPWYPQWIQGITLNNAANFYRMVGIKGEPYEEAVFSPKKKTRAQKKAEKEAELKRLVSGQKTVQKPKRWYAKDYEYKIVFLPRWKVKGGKNSPEFRGIDDPQITRVRANDKVWDVIAKVCQDIASVAWVTCDGWLCVTRPRYNETPYGKPLVYQGPGHPGSVLGVTYNASIADRHSHYWATGQGRSKKSQRGKAIKKAISCYDPSPAFWNTFNTPPTERLYKPTYAETRKGCHDLKMLRRSVRTKMEESIVKSFTYTWHLQGHRADNGVLWTPDSCVEIKDDYWHQEGKFYIAGRQFRKSVDAGTTTILNLVPADIWLACDHDGMSDDQYQEYINSKVGF